MGYFRFRANSESHCFQWVSAVLGLPSDALRQPIAENWQYRPVVSGWSVGAFDGEGHRHVAWGTVRSVIVAAPVPAAPMLAAGPSPHVEAA